MKNRKGFYGRTNKTNDIKLIERIKLLLNSELYRNDEMTDTIYFYIIRYGEIHSLTDKMRFHIKTHIELHFREFGE